MLMMMNFEQCVSSVKGKRGVRGDGTGGGYEGGKKREHRRPGTCNGDFMIWGLDG